MFNPVTHISRHPAFTPDVKRLVAGHNARARIDERRVLYLQTKAQYAEALCLCASAQGRVGDNTQAELEMLITQAEKRFMEARDAYHAVRDTEHALIDLERAA